MTTPPPLFFSFPDRQTFIESVGNRISSVEASTIYELSSQNLPPVTSALALATLTGFSPRFIGLLAKQPSRHYRTFSIRQGRKHRVIQSPRVALKVIQWWFGWHLARGVQFAEHVHGFVPTRSTLTAGKTHVNARWIVSVDLRDFFGSVSRQQVHDALRGLGFPGTGAWIMSDLCTLSGSLPQGSPASPVLSNLVFRQTDLLLQSFAIEHGIRLTRYADDITLSSTEAYPNGIELRLIRILENLGWKIAVDKTEIAIGPSSRSMLGLLVDGPHIRLPRKYRHQLRMMEFMSNKGIDLNNEARFAGNLAYANAVYAASRNTDQLS